MRPVAVVLAFFAALALLIALGRLLSKHRASGMGYLLTAVVLGLAASSTWRLGPVLASFEVPRGTESAAELVFERTAPGQYRATLTRLPAGRMQTFVVAGDEWRIDASSLEWPAAAQRLGAQQRHRLDGLSTRYLGRTDPSAAATATAKYSLVDPAAAGCRPGNVSDVHLYGPWRPLADKARFVVSFQSTGIEVDPANDHAEKAVQARR